MRNKKTLAVLIAGALFAASPLMSTAEAATPKDQLIIGMSMNNMLTFDPAALTGNDAMDVVSNTYEALVELDPVEKSKLLPALAESWTYSDDGKKITFKLRKGVKFQSGNDFTAKDVAWSWARTVKLNLAQASYWKTYGFKADNIDSLVNVVDDYTIELNTPERLDPKLVMYTLASSAGALIIDSELAKKHIVNDDYARDWLNSHSAGSGPYDIAQWRVNDVIIMNRNSSYWRGEPKMRRVMFRHMTESQSLRLMVKQGDIDIAKGLSVADVNALKSENEVKVEEVQKGNVYYLAMSMKDQHFKDKNIRDAVRHLIDYKGINDTIMPSYGVYHQRPIQLGLPATLAEPGYKLDVDMAKNLLNEAGYKDGFKTTIRVLAEPPFLQIATAVQATLAEAGIEAELLTGTGNQVYGAMRERQFEMIVGRGGGGAEPHPHANLRSLAYNPDNRDEAKLTNFQGWRTSFHSEEMNNLIEQAAGEMDEQKQIELYQKAQNLYADLVAPIQPISQVVESVVVRSDLRDYVPHPSYTTHLRDVYKAR
ncbi:ABC transporter substrate-binding protein [Vibrio ziniensis]|uniref:ABC transporter substrate-binding protein n=1 Tax=Vibrio ziniensis TaxID=2711221 RepID=A0A6G7CQV3_9VIBR|nr:ABC transporter substrate-binding protein [Vibrio ziniensis]QIH44482.1 ABC transporter substrate-binding protein [Vibrio ziniensis]